MTAPAGAGSDRVAEALAHLRAQPWYRGQLAHVRHLRVPPPPRRQPVGGLPEPLAAYVEQLGVSLYAHQAAVVDAWRAGCDVVIAAPTASGKSLAFDLAVGDALVADPAARALYLYPTKALARDQLERLVAFDRAAGLHAAPAVYDGDTPGAQRARIRSSSRIVVSNPYALHEYLPQAAAWQRLLSQLAVVVVDEAHRYRGVFGSHVAMVLRRLQRLCERLGARPRFVLASATIANPAEHAAALVGRPVAVVSSDAGAAAKRTVVVWDAMADPQHSAAVQAAAVVGALAEAGWRTLCFTGSRVGTELVAGWAAERASGRRISPYRAGFRPGERRQIERQLRSGELDAVVSTNALELGIDIGGLDAVVLTGYPGTMASTWQQIGRAGRAGQPSLAVLVAGDDPLDQYLVRRPDTLFAAPVERAVISLDNPEVLAGQVLCAAAELPLDHGDEARFGPGYRAVLEELDAAGLVRHGPAGASFCGSFRPAGAVRLDGQGTDAVVVQVDGEVVEVLERWRALRAAHPGAVLLHRGQRFRVRHLDLEAGVAEAEPDGGHDHTEAIVARDYALGEPEAETEVGWWRLHLGPARIRQQVVAARLRRGDEVLATTPLDLPPADLDTRAVWMTPTVALDALVGGGCDQLGALHAAEHALIHAMPLLAMCDRGDAGGLSSLGYAGGGPLVVLYDGHAGGAGIADVAFAHAGPLAALAAEMVAACDCDRGCPRCVYDRACGSGNEPMDRVGAIAVLASLAAE